MKIEQAREVATKALDQLAESLRQGQSDVLRNYLAAVAKFHRYSASNILLIVTQRPGATRVAGYQTWKKLHRQVTRGAKGIVIFAPLVRRVADRNECGVETERESLIGYRTAVVFDVADTSGEPLPALSEFEGDPGRYLAALKRLVAESGCSLEYSESILPARGQCSAGKITLVPEMSSAEEFHVLTHELAHARLHFSSRRAETTKCIRETEAEAVAFVVSQSIGLETNSASWDYVKMYDGDQDTLAQSLGHIQQVSSEILSGIAPPQGGAVCDARSPEARLSGAVAPYPMRLVSCPSVDTTVAVGS
ncbi:MAG TPA: ArdC family protein [Candidatus Acidoferrales bacterium]|nr:ArdC family protein [Candidatus Acidoferrales bacterium]